MKKVLVNIGELEVRCEMTENEKERKKGLSGRSSLAPDEGMLFDFSGTEDTPGMWMKDTTIPLDMIGIGDDDTVIQVYTPKPETEDLMPFPGCRYVLELNAGSGIREGDSFDIDDDAELDRYTMKVLAPDGTAQGLLQGGERIFSRISTRKLIRLAKQAFRARNDREQYEKICKKLGKTVFRELYAQDHREPQYVSLPENKDSQSHD